MKPNKPNLDELEQLCAKATPGPWTVSKGGYNVLEVYCECCAKSEDDARFIAASRDALPQLISEVRSLQGRVVELEKTNEALRGYNNDYRKAFGALEKNK